MTGYDNDPYDYEPVQPPRQRRRTRRAPQRDYSRLERRVSRATKIWAGLNAFYKHKKPIGIGVAVASLFTFSAWDTEPVRRLTGDIITDVSLCGSNVTQDKFSGFIASAQTPDGTLRTQLDINGDTIRFPASMVKVMTLMVVLDAVEAGQVSLDDMVTFSARAVQASPINMRPLGVKAGSKVRLGELLAVLMVRSANDVARALAEHVAGSEAAFAERMNAKARAIGMDDTEFRNASGLPWRPSSGLPHVKQVTTARDMTTMMYHAYNDYPKYRAYLTQRSFVLKRDDEKDRLVLGHNRLMQRRIVGSWRMHAAKTGYIGASGLNMVFMLVDDGTDAVAFGTITGGNFGGGRTACIRRMVRKALP